MESEVQIVFIDTPGIHKPRTKLGEYMTDTAINTFKEVDALVLIVDDELAAGREINIYLILSKMQILRRYSS